MATIDVKDAAGATVAVEKPLAPGRSAAAASRPAVLSTEDKAVLDAVAASLSVLDDFDESDRAKVNLIVGQAGIAAGAGASGVTVPRVTLASDSPGVVTLETGRVPVNPVSGQAGLAGGAGTVSASTLRIVNSTDDTILGSLTETAPATDTASSGLNGRVQRIAQRLTSLISPGLSASVSQTRAANTNTYGANDVLGPTGGGAAAMDFNLAAISASNIMITSVSLERDVAALISGETSYILHLYNVTPPSALADEATFDLPSGDRASYLGSINLGVPVDLGSTLFIEQNGINKQVKLAGTHIFGYLVTVGGYVAASGSVLKVTVNAVQL